MDVQSRFEINCFSRQSARGLILSVKISAQFHRTSALTVHIYMYDTARTAEREIAPERDCYSTGKKFAFGVPSQSDLFH